MLDEEQKRILEELATKKIALDAEHSQIYENNQPVKMDVEGNKEAANQVLLIGCATPLFIIGIIILVAGYLNPPENWGAGLFWILSMGVGWILSILGFFSAGIFWLFRLSEYIYKKVKSKRNTPTN